MANPWWAGQVGLEHQHQASPMKKPDLEISMNATAADHEEEEREHSEDPKEGAVEVATIRRRSRGRPQGSKNKPKPPIFVTRDSPSALRSHVLEIASGADVAESVAQYARRRERGVCVLSANGTVTNVTLRQATAPGGAVMALQGRFEILSLTGSFLPGPAPTGSSGLTIYLAGGQGQVVGGGVVGSLVAAGPVMVIAATFSNGMYERLPLEEHEEENGGQGQAVFAGGDGGGGGGGLGDSPGLQMYNSPPNFMANGGQLNHEAYAAWAAHGGRPPF